MKFGNVEKQRFISRVSKKNNVYMNGARQQKSVKKIANKKSDTKMYRKMC